MGLKILEVFVREWSKGTVRNDEEIDLLFVK